jgi:hypothetical protein
VLLGRGLCDELITHPKDFYRLWRVVMCDHENPMDEEAIDRVGLQSQIERERERIYIHIVTTVLENTGTFSAHFLNSFIDLLFLSFFRRVRKIAKCDY